ncbi:MAG: hypothetical protein HY080_17260 [Gammaproteobacteria bacterium]|nr:hypothetical protein [Gammaproteobacteria bacterium]
MQNGDAIDRNGNGVQRGSREYADVADRYNTVQRFDEADRFQNADAIDKNGNAVALGSEAYTRLMQRYQTSQGAAGMSARGGGVANNNAPDDVGAENFGLRPGEDWGDTASSSMPKVSVRWKQYALPTLPSAAEISNWASTTWSDITTGLSNAYNRVQAWQDQPAVTYTAEQQAMLDSMGDGSTIPTDTVTQQLLGDTRDQLDNTGAGRYLNTAWEGKNWNDTFAGAYNAAIDIGQMVSKGGLNNSLFGMVSPFEVNIDYSPWQADYNSKEYGTLVQMAAPLLIPGVGGEAVGARALGGAERVVANSGERLLWGSWKDYSKVSIEGREYAQIGDRLYTQHSVNRMQPSGLGAPAGELTPGRNISPNFVEDVIRTGQQTHTVVDDVSRTVHWSGNVGVVTENGGNVVVTILRRSNQ